MQGQLIIIIGAGPTGLATALELNRQGAQVRILDRSATPNTESRGTGLQARTLELLDVYGVSDTLVERANMTKAFVTYRHGEEIGRIDFTLAPSRFAGSPALPQAVTERVLRERLAQDGIAVEYGVQITAVEQDADTCVVRGVRPDGDPFVATAGWVVAADGSRSAVRTMLDLPFDGVSYPEGWGLMDATVDWSLPADEVRVFRGDGLQQFVMVPLGGDKYRVQLDHREAAAEAMPPTVEEMQAAFDAYVPVSGTVSAPTWVSAFKVHRRQVVSYRHGRVLLAGDAAHIHTPAGAQGLNTGIQDGINLAWKLALVAAGEADQALLDSYQAERKPIAAGVLQLAEVLARNPEAMLANRSVSPSLLATRVGQLLVNYREGPLGEATGQGEPRLVAGDRVPDVTIGGRSIYRYLRAGGVTVAVFGQDVDVAALEANWGSKIRIWRMDSEDREGAFAKALGITGGAAVIRPDAYLGAVVESSAPSEEIDRWLSDCLRLHAPVNARLAI